MRHALAVANSRPSLASPSVALAEGADPHTQGPARTARRLRQNRIWAQDLLTDSHLIS